MRNQIGFIPKKAELQPDYYKKCFDVWCAVFIGEEDTEFHLQLNIDPWAWQDGNTHAKSISILRQNSKSRTDVTGREYKTIKSALEQLQKIFKKKLESAI